MAERLTVEGQLSWRERTHDGGDARTMAIPVVALPVQGEPVGEEELLDGREPSTVYDRHREHLRRGERHP